MDDNTKKKILIILVALFIAPLIFLGTCFPIGLIGLSINSSMIFLAFILGILVTIFVCYMLIKLILKKYDK